MLSEVFVRLEKMLLSSNALPNEEEDPITLRESSNVFKAQFGV